MTPGSGKPRQVPAVVARCDANKAAQLPQVKTVTLPLVEQPRPAKGKRMPFTYSPGPISIILLKIKAIENYSANTERLNRQREFCSRVKGS